MSFPFQLDQMIINGRRFFEMVEHYEKQISKVVDHQDQSEKNSIFGATLQDRANRIIKILNSYVQAIGMVIVMCEPCLILH
jgi:hypothetical protein